MTMKKIIPDAQQVRLILWNQDDYRWHASLRVVQPETTDILTALRTQEHDEPTKDYSEDTEVMYAALENGLFEDRDSGIVDASMGVLIDNHDRVEATRRKWAAWRNR